MGLDLGSKSLGLAISSSGLIASNYNTFYFKENNYDEALKIMNEVIKKEAITTLVIGLPKHMNNDLGIRGEISLDFKKAIEETINDIEVILWDERTSTKAALKTLIKSGASRKKQKSKKDEIAAVIILQNYLDYKEKTK